MNFTYEEQQVQRLHEAGYSIRAIANHLGIDKSKVQRIIGRIQKVISNTANDTFLDSVGETGNTGGVSRTDTGGVSRTDTAANRGLDTLLNTVPMEMRQPNNQKITVDTPQGRTSPSGIGPLMRQVGILKEDINDFVSDTTQLYGGGLSISYSSYQLYLRRVRRLIQSTSLLADQMGEDYRSLLVTQVLESIQILIEKDFSSVPEHSLLELLEFNLPKRDTSTWLEMIGVDFLHPSNH